MSAKSPTWRQNLSHKVQKLSPSTTYQLHSLLYGILVTSIKKRSYLSSLNCLWTTRPSIIKSSTWIKALQSIGTCDGFKNFPSTHTSPLSSPSLPPRTRPSPATRTPTYGPLGSRTRPGTPASSSCRRGGPAGHLQRGKLPVKRLGGWGLFFIFLH